MDFKVIHSAIETGSMYHETFCEDKSWNSLQSTVLAGQFNMNATSDIEERKEQVETIDEEDSMSNLSQDDNILNMNIDARSDDDADVFFDCELLQTDFPMRVTSQSLDTPIETFSRSDYKKSYNYSSSTDSGLVETTGSMVAQIVDDLKNHVHSTPIIELDTEYSHSMESSVELNSKSKRSIQNINSNLTNSINDVHSKRKLSFTDYTESIEQSELSPLREPSMINDSNKENYYAGKYSRAVFQVNMKTTNKKLLKSPVNYKSKVAKIKKFFENKSSLAEESNTNQHLKPVLSEKKSATKKLEIKPPSAFRSKYIHSITSTKSPFKTTKEVKVNKISIKPRYLTNSKTTLHKNSPKNTKIVQSGKSPSFNSNKETKINKISMKPRYLTNPKTTLNKKSPKNAKTVQSAIMKRRSIGLVKSPVKPVSALRKIFSPSNANLDVKQNQIKTTKKLRIPSIVLDNTEK